MYGCTRLLSVKAFTDEGVKLRDRIISSNIDGVIFCDIYKTGEKIRLCSAESDSSNEKTSDENRKSPVVNKNERREVLSPLGEWVRTCFSNHIGMVFIGAVAIAVRQIAPHIIGKLVDSPVIVIDEKGEYVIPILSGHVGGANELSKIIADKIGAKAVITTATDLRNKKGIDIYAKENFLGIANKDAIKNVSMKILRNETIEKNVDFDIVSFEDYQNPKLYGNTGEEKLLLYEKPYVIGIGCKKDTDASKLARFIKSSVFEYLDEEGVSLQGDSVDEKYEKFISGVAAITSIDNKKNELAINLWAEQNMIPFITYSAGELASLDGDFDDSPFVAETVGVGNVCERSAALFAENRGESGDFAVKKKTHAGMTFALFKRKSVYVETII